MKQKTINISGLKISNSLPFTLIAGMCVIEDEKSALKTAVEIKKICSGLGIGFICKFSFDKANRSSIRAYRGPGLDKGLEVIRYVKKEAGVRVLVDIHSPDQAEKLSEIADILQVPAFLCRQTDLLLAAARTGLPVNIKKGQFISPKDVKNIIDKVLSCGPGRILLTERGFVFGYNNLVVDMRALQIMKETGYPVIFDATHSVQLPGGLGDSTGGEARFIEPLSRAATAVGIAGLFLEVHENPARALSDGKNALRLNGLKDYLIKMKSIDGLIKSGG